MNNLNQNPYISIALFKELSVVIHIGFECISHD